eukprot:14817812-Ditylum_brightwellii.AAC.1
MPMKACLLLRTQSPLQWQNTHDKVPVTPIMDNGAQEKNMAQMRYNYSWRITFPAPDNTEITPRNKFATLLSMI